MSPLTPGTDRHSDAAAQMHEIPVALARAYRDLEAAALKYVPRGRDSGWSAWNNQDGHDWPELRKALDSVERARRG